MSQCRVHGLNLDLASGCMANLTNIDVAAYPVAVADGTTYLFLPDSPAQESAP